MNDVSKTNELIAELREYATALRASVLVHRTGADLIEQAADALEAATRVPVQGEPNDDRETLVKILEPVEALIEGAETLELGYEVADAILAAGFSRAAVPDAATAGRMSLAELEDMAETHAFCADRLFIETELVEEIRAERDAALAAVERARATAISIGLLGKLQPGDHSEILSAAVKDILAALDGAPEPEDVWEYGYELIEPDDRNVFEREGDFISAAFAYRAAKKRIHEERHPDVPSLQYSIILRRKAGPWLPVEGESKP